MNRIITSGPPTLAPADEVGLDAPAPHPQQQARGRLPGQAPLACAQRRRVAHDVGRAALRVHHLDPSTISTGACCQSVQAVALRTTFSHGTHEIR